MRSSRYYSLAAISSSLRLDDALRLSVLGWIHSDDLEIGLLQHLAPLALRPLHGGTQSHHIEVLGRGPDAGAALSHNEFVYEELGVARFHGVADVFEDSQALFGGPVVETLPDVVGTGTCIGSLAELIHRLKGRKYL